MLIAKMIVEIQGDVDLEDAWKNYKVRSIAYNCINYWNIKLFCILLYDSCVMLIRRWIDLPFFLYFCCIVSLSVG